MENTAARKRRQVPEGYLVIDIDPHKKRHAAVAIAQDFTIHSKFKFDNTREGLEMMLGRARAEMVKTGCRGVMFAIEAVKWRHNSCVPGSLLRVSSHKVFMPNFTAHTMPISG